VVLVWSNLNSAEHAFRLIGQVPHDPDRLNADAVASAI